MSEITDYVDLTIVIADAAISIPSFGSLCCVGSSPSGDAGLHQIAATSSGLRSYTESLSGATTDAAYAMLGAVVAQTPHTDELYWYNPKNEPSESLTITPLGPFTEGKVYKMQINSAIISHTASATADAAEISAFFAGAADFLVGVSAVDNTGTFTLSEFDDTFTTVFLRDFKSDDFEVEVASSTANDVTLDLNAALSANPDMYAFCLDVDNDTDLAALSTWAETNRRIVIARTKDQDGLTGGGIVDTIHATGVHRTMVFWSEDDVGRADCALLGSELSKNPGASDWQFKRLASVSRSQLTPAQISAIKGKNGCVYTVTSGVAMTDNGVAASGRPMALTRNVDWLEARINQAVMTVFATTDIVILAESGIALMETALRGVMEEAEDANVLLPGWSVTAPSEADISTADKNAGLMKGFKFAGVAAVGTRKVEISGVLS